MALHVKYIIIVTGDTVVQGGGTSQPATCHLNHKKAKLQCYYFSYGKVSFHLTIKLLHLI